MPFHPPPPPPPTHPPILPLTHPPTYLPTQPNRTTHRLTLTHRLTPTLQVGRWAVWLAWRSVWVDGNVHTSRVGDILQSHLPHRALLHCIQVLAQASEESKRANHTAHRQNIRIRTKRLAKQSKHDTSRHHSIAVGVGVVVVVPVPPNRHMPDSPKINRPTCCCRPCCWNGCAPQQSAVLSCACVAGTSTPYTTDAVTTRETTTDKPTTDGSTTTASRYEPHHRVSSPDKTNEASTGAETDVVGRASRSPTRRGAWR
jgi:hypothetical protein